MLNLTEINRLMFSIFLSFFCLLILVKDRWHYVILVKELHQKQPPEVFYQKSILKNFANFTGKQACCFTKREALAQVFSCEFCEVFKSRFFTELPEWLKQKERKVYNFEILFSSMSLLRRDFHFPNIWLNSRITFALPEKCPNTQLFLVRIFLYSD